MLRGIRTRLTYANVTATLALFVALGGTGYAALSIPRNSVGTGQLRPRAVRTSKLANGAVRREKLAKRAVSGDKVGYETLTGRNIDERTLAAVPEAILAFNAGRAFSAGSADTLQGKTPSDFQDKCPAGTTLFASGCVDSAVRVSASWTQAANQCSVDGSLLDPAELHGYAHSYGGPGPELSSGLQSLSSAYTVDTSNQGALGAVGISTPTPYRCIRPLTNYDPINR